MSSGAAALFRIIERQSEAIVAAAERIEALEGALRHAESATEFAHDDPGWIELDSDTREVLWGARETARATLLPPGSPSHAP